MAYMGPGSSEWIEEQYRIAARRKMKPGTKEWRESMWRSASYYAKGGVSGKPKTGSTLPVRGNPPPSSSGGGGPRDGGGPSAADLQAQAEARALARENELRRKAGTAFQNKAKNLEGQAKALAEALTQFGKARDQNLQDISKVLGDQIDMLKEQHGIRSGTFLEMASNNEKAAAGQASESFENLVRERQETMTGIMAQGAGETDQLRAMVLAARNWRDNAAEGSRSYFDTQSSVNAGIRDLNMDTQSGFANAASQAESERERVWQNFFDRRSETFTQLGNVRQSQADYMESAKEMDVGSGGGTYASQASKAFMDAANEAGKSYKQQGIPQWIQDWKGQREVDAVQSNTNLAAAMRFQPIQQAEGATLRSWAA